MRTSHPVNGSAYIDEDGVWGGKELPVVDWEDSRRRVIVPVSLFNELPINVPILRWSGEKLHHLAVKRPDVLSVVDRLSFELENWSAVGVERQTGNWRVLFAASDGRNYALSLGQDKHGNWNAITIVGSSGKGFWSNRLRGLTSVKSRP